MLTKITIVVFLTYFCTQQNNNAATSALISVHHIGSAYERDKVVHILPTTKEHVKIIDQLTKSLKLDFWSDKPRSADRLDNSKPLVVRVPGGAFKSFQKHARQHNIAVNVTTINIAEQVRREYVSSLNSRQSLTTNWTIVNNYASLSDIGNWMDTMCRNNPTVATCMDIGESYENRKLKVIKIGFPGENKKSVFIDATIHAREWIAGAATIWFINRLLTGYQHVTKVNDLLQKVDFYILPIANPDGYEYSRLPGQRLWRKNRNPTFNSECVGVDGNRNYAMQWGTIGSADPCDEEYQGPSPFSEAETIAIRNFIMTQLPHLLAYFTLHSYGNFWLIPWGYATDAPRLYDYDDLYRVARAGTQAIINNSDDRGKNWKYGNSVDLLYASSGCSDDWAKSQGVKYVYTLELRPSDSDPSDTGFIIEPEQIKYAGMDLFNGITSAVLKMLEPNNPSGGQSEDGDGQRSGGSSADSGTDDGVPDNNNKRPNL